MKNVFLILSILLFSVSAAGQSGVTYRYQISRVIDGDTIVFKAPFLPLPLKKELHLRIFGVDTPEKGGRAKCQKESDKGNQATEFTKQEIAKAKDAQIVLMSWDKFGGRVLGDVLLDGKSLRKMLIQSGYAREYYGEAKASWCN